MPQSALSEKSDMFALASLMFHLEHGFTPELSLENGRLILPELQSGNQSTDEIIQTAWLAKYSHTSDMVHHLDLIDAQIIPNAGSTGVLLGLESLRNQVMVWRDCRKHRSVRVRLH